MDADAVVDSSRAVLLWAPRRIVPSYAVPAEDISAELGSDPPPLVHRSVGAVLAAAGAERFTASRSSWLRARRRARDDSR